MNKFIGMLKKLPVCVRIELLHLIANTEQATSGVYPLNSFISFLIL